MALMTLQLFGIAYRPNFLVSVVNEDNFLSGGDALLGASSALGGGILGAALLIADIALHRFERAHLRVAGVGLGGLVGILVHVAHIALRQCTQGAHDHQRK